MEIIENYILVTGQTGAYPVMTLGDDGLPEQLPIKCGTPAISDFVLNYDKLDKSLLKSLGVTLVDRPTHLEDSLDSPSGRFRVHYTTTGDDGIQQNGIANFIEQVAMILDSVYVRIIDSLGYPSPPLDGYEPGGDEKYDVYMLNLGAMLYGLTYLDSLSYGSVGSKRATSFIELNSDPGQLWGYENHPMDAIRVTCAHEFFHAVQFGIDFAESEGPSFERRYWMEMSAVWMEEEIYDDINDYYYYLPFFFNYHFNGNGLDTACGKSTSNFLP